MLCLDKKKERKKIKKIKNKRKDFFYYGCLDR